MQYDVRGQLKVKYDKCFALNNPPRLNMSTVTISNKYYQTSCYMIRRLNNLSRYGLVFDIDTGMSPYHYRRLSHLRRTGTGRDRRGTLAHRRAMRYFDHSPLMVHSCGGPQEALESLSRLGSAFFLPQMGTSPRSATSKGSKARDENLSSNLSSNWTPYSWNSSLNSTQLHSTPLSINTTSQGIKAFGFDSGTVPVVCFVFQTRFTNTDLQMLTLGRSGTPCLDLDVIW
ncbi:hypothetical protein B0I72DRAFT_176868 [Yarrowia lipolytica]|nr:hypothetical protein B0I72DRAFT_176868 [Yarrowia lipolytica]